MSSAAPHADQGNRGHAYEMGDVGDPFDLRHYLDVVRRRLWVIVTFFVVVATLGAFHVYSLPAIYRAGARVLVQEQAPQFMEFGHQAVGGIYGRHGGSQQTQIEIINSPAVLQIAAESPKVARYVQPRQGGQAAGSTSTQKTRGLWGEIRRTISALLGTRATPPPRPPAPWETLRSAIRVTAVEGTDFLSISADSGNPAKAAAIVNAVAGAYKEYNRQKERENVGEAFSRLQELTAKQEEKLNEAEQSLQQYGEEINAVSLTDRDGSQLSLLNELRSELTRIRMERMDLAARLSFLENSGPHNPEGHPLPEYLLSLFGEESSSTLSELRALLLEARKRVEILTENYGPEAPQLAAAQVELGVLKGQVEEVVQNRLDALNARLKMLETKETQLEDSHAAQKQEAVTLAKDAVRYSRLENRLERNQKLYDVLIERMREVDLTSSYPTTKVELVEAATVPQVPARPNRMRMLVFFCFLGLAGGCGLAFFIDYMDDAVKTPEQMESYSGTGALGFVPRMESAPDGREDFQYHGLISVLEPASSASEAYREIRTNLFFSTATKGSKTILVTSSGAREGKTTSVTNLAWVMAQGGKRVLLIDADLRRPTVHRIAACPSNPGVTSVLTGQASMAECVRQLEVDGHAVDGAYFLPSGPIPPNPAELLDSEAMINLLEEAAGQYDRVLIDSAPVLVAADASILGARSDAVILVVEAEQTARSALRHSANQLRGVNASVLGGILNNVKVSRLGHYHSGYYYYGYSRYYRDYGSTYRSDHEEAM